MSSVAIPGNPLRILQQERRQAFLTGRSQDDRAVPSATFILFYFYVDFYLIMSTHCEGDRITTTAAKGEGSQQYLRSTELRVLDVNWEPETRRGDVFLLRLYSHRVLKRKSRLRPPLWSDYLFVTSVSRFSAHSFWLFRQLHSTRGQPQITYTKAVVLVTNVIARTYLTHN